VASHDTVATTLQYDTQGDPTMTAKQTRLAAADAAKLARFCETASLERRSGTGPLAGAPALRDFADTPFDSHLLATIP
jgi:hypothetical protein